MGCQVYAIGKIDPFSQIQSPKSNSEYLTQTTYHWLVLLDHHTLIKPVMCMLKLSTVMPCHYFLCCFQCPVSEFTWPNVSTLVKCVSSFPHVQVINPCHMVHNYIVGTYVLSVCIIYTLALRPVAFREVQIYQEKNSCPW